MHYYWLHNRTFLCGFVRVRILELTLYLVIFVTTVANKMEPTQPGLVPSMSVLFMTCFSPASPSLCSFYVLFGSYDVRPLLSNAVHGSVGVSVLLHPQHMTQPVPSPSFLSDVTMDS